ncbi:hypothetical protein HMPREF0490_00653 [Lachnospiraceae bacterium 6_1_37FAA]|nr:hypothetical protein HMPREF0490_00653 [Lachnospiraceae bacterium 6_1_37FAA]
MIRRRTITSYEWHVATGNETVVLLDCVKSFFRRLELIGGTEQLTTTGKNLFDIKKASDVSNYITTETLAKIDITAAIVFDVKKNTNYCLSVSGKTDQPSINFNIANDVQRKSIFNKLKTEETLNSLDSGKIYVGFSGGDTELNATKLSQEYFDIQLEEASSKTPYEPYTGLKPSPSPEYPQEIKSAGKWNEEKQKYEVDVKVTGKNLLDIKDITSETPQWLEIPCLIKNNIYIKSNNSTVLVENNQARLIVCFKDGTSRAVYDNSMADGLPFKVNSENPITTIKVRGTHIKSGVYSEIQVEYGNEPTPYEPYTEQTLTLTSDRPITKWDKLVEQSGQIGWLYNVEKIALTGEERWAIYNKQFYTIVYDIQRFDRAFCECYDYSDTLHSLSKDCTFTIGAGVYSNSIYLKDDKNLRLLESGSENITESLKVFSQYLKDMLGNGTPIEILLKSKKSQFVPLSQEEQTQLRNLHSYNGTTNIMVDSGEVPCGISVEYKTKS